jgi:large subunit ribosomal protein L22
MTSAVVRGAEVPTTGKTNERPGTRAVAKHIRMSATKVRVVLDLIRGKDVSTADEILRFSERDAAIAVRKVLGSAVANAMHNDDQIPEDLFVSACFADEGKTLRRMRPRARGRASRIRKRTCHITVIVARMPEAELERRRQREATRPGSRASRRAGQQAADERRRRIRRSRQVDANQDHDDHEGHDHVGHEHEGHEHDEPTADDVMEEAIAVEHAGDIPEPATEAEVVSAEEGGERFSEAPEIIEQEGKTMADELPGGDAGDDTAEGAADTAEKDEE